MDDIDNSSYLETAVNAAPIGIGLVVDRVITQINDYFLWMTGYSKKEVLGKNARMLYLSDTEYDYVGREKYRQIREDKRKVGTVETRWLKKDGQVIDVLLSSMPLNFDDFSKGVTFTALDITERRNAENAVVESKNRLRYVFDQLSSVPVQGYDKDRKVIYWNSASEEVYGYSCNEAMGQKLEDLIIPEPMREFVINDINNWHLNGIPVPSGEITLVNKNGNLVYVYSSHVLIENYDGEKEMFCIDVNLTERKKTEEEKDTLQKQLVQSQKMESIGRLAGGVAHDFNNMLSAIFIYSEMGLKKIDDKHELHHNLSEIYNAAFRSAELTKQLLTFARKQEIIPQEIDLNDSINKFFKMLQRLIGENIELKWLPFDDPCMVVMDPSQVDQILANLCVNARDAIANEGNLIIETNILKVKKKDIFKNFSMVLGDYIVLKVSDNGCGMDPDILANIFEPFYTTKEEGKGTGLGLATVYGIVKQNNGYIDVSSNVGVGSSFTIYLPRYITAEKVIEESSCSIERVNGFSATILLVEDETFLSDMFTEMLEDLGYTVLAAQTPKNAIEMAKEYSGKIDLLFTDVIMPEMNGKELSDTISSICPDIRQLFMSGYTDDIIADKGVVYDNINFIQKPFSIDDLKEKINYVLRF